MTLCAFVWVGIADAIFQPLTKNDLVKAIHDWNRDASTARASYGYIGSWDTKAMVDMSEVFLNVASFNASIGKWNTAGVTNMSSMFQGTVAFDQVIAEWNTARVAGMESMFYNASAFNQVIAKWNIARVATMDGMFLSASAFNQVIAEWNTATVASMNSMFYNASAFNQVIAKWNIARVAYMDGMFFRASAFNQVIAEWNTARVGSMAGMFSSASAFDQVIGQWNTASVEIMMYLFSSAIAFNQVIETWNTASVSTMVGMFWNGSAFNQVVGEWNTASVTSMDEMFSSASAFNQMIAEWNTARVGTMKRMFYDAHAFNNAIGSWNICNVESMEQMLSQARSFTQDLRLWNTSRVRNMSLLAWRSPFFIYSSCNLLDIRMKLFVLLFGALTCWRYHATGKRYIVKSLRKMVFPFMREQMRLHNIAAWSKECQVQDPFLVGRDLHGRISPDRWCITRDDLDVFEYEVRLAWRTGSIPNGSGNFENPFHNDPKIGPTMYQVNEFFIKPITASYGGMSFALLLHPDGLSCDCFATHAWAEGIFEFCNKVRRGWPPQCTSMYICFLANPQNLNISEILDVPILQSPFARALSSASHLLVVPNRFISIYTRLWCCFEAYVGYTSSKTILLPRAAVFVEPVFLRLFVCLFTSTLACLGADFFFQPYIFDCLFRGSQKLDSLELQADMDTFNSQRLSLSETAQTSLIYIIISSVALSFLQLPALCRPSPPSISGICLNLLASAASGININLSIHYNALSYFAYAPLSTYFAFVWTSTMAFLFAMCCVIHIVKCRTEEARLEESYQLQFSKLTEASCSDDNDRRKILEALADREDEVENAIHILMKQGMSTSETRSWGGSSSSAYFDMGSIVFAATIWPAYSIFLWLCSGSFSRLHMQALMIVLLSNFALWWTFVTADTDLINVIARSQMISLSISVLCGGVVGCWGIAGGHACAAYYVADRLSRVQQKEYHRLVEFLLPLTICSCGCFTWLAVAIVIFGDSFCLWQEFAGVLGFSILWGCAAKAVCGSCVPKRMNRASGVLCLFSSSAHCLVAAANIAIITLNKFFDGDDTPFNQFFHLSAQAQFGIVSLLVVSALCPLWLFSRRRRSLKQQPAVNIEMCVLNARDVVEVRWHW